MTSENSEPSPDGRGEIPTTIAVSRAQRSLRTILWCMARDEQSFVITRRGRPVAVLMSMQEYRSISATPHLLRAGANAAHLERSMSQLTAGRDEQHLPDAPHE